MLRHAKDFRRPEAMADALLHPQDRAYSVAELYAWLDRCAMSFGRWIEQAPYLAQCGSIARSPHAARLASLSPREQHAAVELFRGTMVSHSFIAYRDDRSEDGQPITFVGDRWREYIPIAMRGVLILGGVAARAGGRSAEGTPKMKARRDDRILCENGHVGGRFLRDVPDNRPVQTDDLSIAGQLMTAGTG